MVHYLEGGNPFAILASIIFSIVLPVAIILVRKSVKTQRQRMIVDLEKAYFLHDDAQDAASKRDVDRILKEDIFPSFEFVKFKYYLDEGTSARAGGGNTSNAHYRDYGWLEYSLSAMPLCLILMFLGIRAFHFLLGSSFTPSGIGFLWMIGFLGAYLYSMRTLLRSVENFDLKPISFIVAAVNVVFGTAVAIVIVLASAAIFGIGENATVASALLILVAFVVGYVPDLGLKTAFKFSRLWSSNRQNHSVYKSYAASPLEIVDGIDYEIADRLARFNILSIQNLATANPIMLFVETPYGIFQTMDWVAQAQLCTAVGPDRLVKLWSYGIRTIFDLERAVLGESRDDVSMSTEYLRRHVAYAVLGDDFIARAANPHLPGSAPPSADESDRSIKAVVRYMIDDIHVHRLRQIWMFIQAKLDHRTSTLPDPARWPRSLAMNGAAKTNMPDHRQVKNGGHARVHRPSRSAIAP